MQTIRNMTCQIRNVNKAISREWLWCDIISFIMYLIFTHYILRGIVRFYAIKILSRYEKHICNTRLGYTEPQT